MDFGRVLNVEFDVFGFKLLEFFYLGGRVVLSNMRFIINTLFEFRELLLVLNDCLLLFVDFLHEL